MVLTVPLTLTFTRKIAPQIFRERRKEPADMEFSAVPQAGNGMEQVSSDDGGVLVSTGA